MLLERKDSIPNLYAFALPRNRHHRYSRAFLVAWGWYAQHIDLIQELQALSLKQKHYHQPQTKMLEFLVAILAEVQHWQEISLAAHPLDKD